MKWEGTFKVVEVAGKSEQIAKAVKASGAKLSTMELDKDALLVKLEFKSRKMVDLFAYMTKGLITSFQFAGKSGRVEKGQE